MKKSVTNPVMCVVAPNRYCFRFVVARAGGIKESFEKMGEGANPSEALTKLLADMTSIRIESICLLMPTSLDNVCTFVYTFKDQISAARDGICVAQRLFIEGEAVRKLNELYDSCSDLQSHPGQQSLNPVVLFAIAQLKTAIEKAYPAR